jgi:hypothetical protein
MVRTGTWNPENRFALSTPASPTSDEATKPSPPALVDTITIPGSVRARRTRGRPTRQRCSTTQDRRRLSAHPTADPDGWGIRVGFLCKLPLLDVRQIATLPSPSRPHPGRRHSLRWAGDGPPHTRRWSPPRLEPASI